MQAVLISRFSSANCLGAGTGALLEALRAKRSGLAPCEFETAAVDTWVGQVSGLEDMRIKRGLEDYDCRVNRLAQLALEQDGFSAAVAQARSRYGAARIGVFTGTSTSGILETEVAYRRRDPRTGALPPSFRYRGTLNTYALGDFTARYLGLSGPSFVVSSACSSTAKVFGAAARLMAAGACDAAVVGGADTLCLTTLYGFRSLELTSQGPCRPFDAERDGISLGEGAGFALLEKPGRGAPSDSLMLLGVGESSDAHHMSTPHPEGAGAKLALRRALEAAGLAPADIDYVNVHGTATRTNDAAEDKALVEVFGRSMPCSSTKGATGHLLGAAGITEAIVSMLAVRHGILPGSAHTRRVDPGLQSAYLLDPRPARVRRVLTNSFGFGGSNCSLVIGEGR
ncbi:MAG TPA: beta-ketoacyl-[acyl-carrier-protein] synthase family protein [Burkholderiales bacterium]|nr:beta-ketoacyl-[acyl-carrier-protein] synthase family protein [Burkholderiales bacterium]